ncbi:MAG: hypothetical protein LM577_05325, partial [Thermoproteaceae archaeon]|nr:hypothetical protein [Thermoproteaceae archaeon]
AESGLLLLSEGHARNAAGKALHAFRSLLAALAAGRGEGSEGIERRGGPGPPPVSARRAGSRG